MSGFLALLAFLLVGAVLMATGGEWAAMKTLLGLAATLSAGFLLGRLSERERATSSYPTRIEP